MNQESFKQLIECLELSYASFTPEQKLFIEKMKEHIEMHEEINNKNLIILNKLFKKFYGIKI